PSPIDEDPFANFPRYEQALTTPPSGFLPSDLENNENVQATQDALGQVTNFYKTQLPERGFQDPQLTKGDDKFSIFEIAKPGSKSRYLHLFAVEGKTVLMLLSKPISETQLARLQDIQELSPEERLFESVLVSIYNDFNLQELNAEDVTEDARNLLTELTNDQESFQWRGTISATNAESTQAIKSQIVEKLEQELLTSEIFADVRPIPFSTDIQQYTFYTQNEEKPFKVIFVPVESGGIGIITDRVINRS
ncbi:hypothetical protein PN462_15755, partial [Spirulina sp. CS-785/01]|uniref:hypothetical protein n=1 Tax=Spirulina sp. CS-785/01 TaxID=3021716 RepID=UPI00232CF55E